MLREVLSVGDKIDIKRIDLNNRPMHGVRAYVSQLIDFADSDVIYIAAPIIYGKVIVLEVGENYNLCFYSAKGLYQCNGVVLSNHKENKTVISVLRITSNLEKFQRRQYFRMECILDIAYYMIKFEEEILEKRLKSNDFKNADEQMECKNRLIQLGQDWIPGTITDISGGGARFNSGTQHNKGSKIKIKMDFIKNVEKKSLVVRTVIIASNQIDNRTGVFEHRIEFVDISQRDRELIIKYIFEQERKRRSYETS